jgi:hypothetical protein
MVFAAALIGLMAGCNHSPEAGDQQAKAVDPVMKQSGAADPAANAASASAARAAQPASNTQEQVARANPEATAPAAGPKSELDLVIDKFVDTGVDGVVDTTTDKNGAITKVVVVGAAPISTVLGAADGLLTARKEARLRAAGKFRQFLQEKVSIEEGTETERVVKLESKAGSDLTESGKKISKNTEKYKTVSEGMVRGLQVLGYKTVSLNKKEKVYVMVCGWDSATSKAASGLAKELDADDGTPSGGTSESNEERRKLHDDQKVTPAGKKFFDKKQPGQPPPDDR